MNITLNLDSTTLNPHAARALADLVLASSLQECPVTRAYAKAAEGVPALEPAPEPETVAAPEPALEPAPEPETVAAPEPETVATPEPETVAAPEPETVAKRKGRSSAKPPTSEPVTVPTLGERFADAMKRLEQTLIDGEMNEEGIAKVMGQWEVKGAVSIAELEQAIAKNLEFLAKVASAKAVTVPPASKPVEEIKAIPEPTQPQEEAKVLTLGEARAALKAYTAKNGMAEGSALLGKFGKVRVSEILELPVEMQQKFKAQAYA